VEVVDGLQAGAAATTDASGRFSLSGPFDNTTRVRASLDGYVATAQILSADHRYNCNIACQGLFQFYLSPVAPSVNISGEYTLSFTADSACTNLPDEVRTRTYTGTIPSASATQSVPRVMLSDATFLGNFKSFDVGIAGNYVDFSLDGEHDPPVVEQLAPNTYVAFSGDARLTVPAGASTLSAPFAGWIEFCVMPSAMGAIYNCGTSNTTGEPIPGAAVVRAHCDSRNHRLVLIRR
jgi:hypothetical protein